MHITVFDDLSLRIGEHAVARLRPDEALDLAEVLARRAFRRIAAEERADALLGELAATNKPYRV